MGAIIGLLIAAGSAVGTAFWKASQKTATPGFTTPTSASSAVLLAQDTARRKAQNRQRKTQTGGLADVSATLGKPGLWGLG